MKPDFSKRKMILRQLLIGRKFYEAVFAMEYAGTLHTGTRKDGITPEFEHQVSIALYCLTLPDLLYPEETIAAIMLHDVREDYDVSDLEVRKLFRDEAFGRRVADAVESMTKVWRGIKKPAAQVMAEIAADPIASIAKGCDRIHNLQSMPGVFSMEKQKDYIRESVGDIMPMLKTARRRFPHQVSAYENIKWMLTSQIELIEHIHGAEGRIVDDGSTRVS